MEPSSPSSATFHEGFVNRSLTRRIYCGEGLPREIAQAICRGDIDRLIASAVPLQIKGRCTAVHLEHPAASLLIKRHTWGNLTRTLRMLWRTPAARRCARLSQQLADAGIPTPIPRATVEDRLGPFGYRSYLVTDYVPGVSLYHYLRENKLSAATASHLARQVAQIWQQLDELGISHNDMKPENFIVDPEQKVWLIDLERVRFHRKQTAMRSRQLVDVKCFFHPRTWKHCPDTARMFHQALFRTETGRSLREYAEQTGRLSEIELPDSDSDNRLSVVVLGSRGAAGRTVVPSPHWPDASAVAESIASVQDIADEVLVFDAESRDLHGMTNSRLRLFDGTEGGRGTDAVGGQQGGVEALSQPAPRFPWVLVLHAGERVTPDLARELQETIAADPPQNAFRIPLKECCLGRPMDRTAAEPAEPVRLIRRDGDQSPLAESAADEGQTSAGRLSASLWRDRYRTVAELVTDLNDSSTQAAAQRFHQGEPARLWRAFARLPLGLLARYLWQGGLAAGWIGLHVSFLESVFDVVEEAKLWQMRSGLIFDRPASTDSPSWPAIVPADSVPTSEHATPSRHAKVA